MWIPMGSGSWDADPLKQGACALPCGSPLDDAVQLQWLDDLSADFLDRAECVHSALENDRDLSPPTPTCRCLAVSQDVLAVEHYSPAHSCGGWEQAHQGEHRCRLPA